MIVPQYWAEARRRERTRGRQVTIRRFGWSDTSQAEALANAERRADEALARFKSGEKIVRREPKLAYNGATGVPIREEIVEMRGASVVTRNLYGARCLNTPDVLFADIDFETETPGTVFLGTMLAMLIVGIGAGVYFSFAGLGFFITFASIFFGALGAAKIYRGWISLSGGPEKIARRRIDSFLKRNPGWHLRLYRTPAGLRLLAMHRTFDPTESAVHDCFKALGVDRVYARMCSNQRCFRARVSPKPWRIGINAHLRPRPGVWPIPPERMPERRRWIDAYERAATAYASCQFIETLGSGPVAPSALAVQKLHDSLSRAASGLPVA